jgi:hypothetical protein
MDIREIGWGCMDWIDVAKGNYQWIALVNMVMNEVYHLLEYDAVYIPVLVSITEELLGRNSSGSGQENREYDRGDSLR